MPLQRSDFDVDFCPIGAGWIPLTRTETFQIKNFKVTARIAYSGSLSIYREFSMERFPKLYSRSGEPLFKSVLAVEALVDDEHAYYGLSFCSRKEDFSLYKGTVVAFSRLANHMIEGQPGGEKVCRHLDCMQKRAEVAGILGSRLYEMARSAILSGLWVKHFAEVSVRVSS